MPIGNQLMRARVGTYNFSRKVLKPKIFSSEENKFYTMHCFSKIMAYLVLVLYYFLSICLVIFIFHKFLSFYAITAYFGKSSNALHFINISVILPLWHCYYLDQVMLKQTLVLKNHQLSNFVTGT